MKPKYGKCKCGAITKYSSTGMCIHCYNLSRIGSKRSEAFRDGQRRNAIEWYSQHPEQRELRRKRMRKSWETGALTPIKVVRPPRSKAECRFFSELERLCPYTPIQGHVIKTATRRWILPDIFFPRLNLVVEFHGDYWHANPSRFKNTDKINGVPASAVWERDAKRESEIRKRHGLVVVWQSQAEAGLRELTQIMNWECETCAW